MPEAAVFTVLGSGFGMYGYLPALIECGRKVVLPERYRSTVSGRRELVQYLPQIAWCDSTEQALARADGAVVALRAADQADWIPRLVRMPDIAELVLEKPLAPTPQLAARLVNELDQSGKRYRVGYTFRFLPWAQRLRTALGGGISAVRLDWGFLAHHYRADLENWKRFDRSGGGALRFYGIQLIALLSEYGYDDVLASITTGPSDGETAQWEATFTGSGLCPFVLRIDTQAGESRFEITVQGNDGGGALVNEPAPFPSMQNATAHVRDPRVDVICQLCRSLGEPDEGHAQRQRDIVALWARVEAVSRRASASPA